MYSFNPKNRDALRQSQRPQRTGWVKKKSRRRGCPRYLEPVINFPGELRDRRATRGNRAGGRRDAPPRRKKKKKNDHRSIIDRVVALLDFQRRTVNATPIIARESNSLTTSTERKRARFEKQIKKSKIKKKKKRKSVIVLIITCFQRRERASQNRMQIGNQSRAVLYWKHTLSSSSSSSLSRFKQFLTSSPFRRSRSTGCVVSLRRNNEPFAYRIAVYRQLSST